MLNNQTIEFHLLNIRNNNRYLAHKKELENEISSIRATSLFFSGKPLGTEKYLEANILEKKLKESEQKRLIG